MFTTHQVNKHLKTHGITPPPGHYLRGFIQCEDDTFSCVFLRPDDPDPDVDVIVEIIEDSDHDEEEVTEGAGAVEVQLGEQDVSDVVKRLSFSSPSQLQVPKSSPVMQTLEDPNHEEEEISDDAGAVNVQLGKQNESDVVQRLSFSSLSPLQVSQSSPMMQGFSPMDLDQLRKKENISKKLGEIRERELLKTISCLEELSAQIDVVKVSNVPDGNTDIVDCFYNEDTISSDTDNEPSCILLVKLVAQIT